jgi:hypothetical protein
MPRHPNQKQQQDLGIRLEQLKSLFTLIQQEIEQLSSRGGLAPLGAWIVRYQARGRGGTYWYIMSANYLSTFTSLPLPPLQT